METAQIKQKLMELSVTDSEKAIYLTAYADMLVYDKEFSIAAAHFGGYPEQVAGMADLLCSGCSFKARVVIHTKKILH